MTKINSSYTEPTYLDAAKMMVPAAFEAIGKLAVSGAAAYTSLTMTAVDKATGGASTEKLKQLAAQSLTQKGVAGSFARALLLLDQLAKKHKVEAVGGASLIPVIASEIGFGVASPVVALAYLTFLADTAVFCSTPAVDGAGNPTKYFSDKPGAYFNFGDVRLEPEAAPAEVKARVGS